MTAICGIIVMLLLVYPFIRLLKDRCYPVRYTLMALLASIGTWGRIAMIISVIGIPFNRIIDGIMSGQVYAYFKHYSANPSDVDSIIEGEDMGTSIVKEIEEIYIDEQRKQERRGAEMEREENNKPKVEVTRRNGYFIENLKVNSDGTMYWDPDDGEWKKISDLEKK